LNLDGALRGDVIGGEDLELQVKRFVASATAVGRRVESNIIIFQQICQIIPVIFSSSVTSAAAAGLHKSIAAAAASSSCLAPPGPNDMVQGMEMTWCMSCRWERYQRGWN